MLESKAKCVFGGCACGFCGGSHEAVYVFLAGGVPSAVDGGNDGHDLEGEADFSCELSVLSTLLDRVVSECKAYTALSRATHSARCCSRSH